MDMDILLYVRLITLILIQMWNILRMFVNANAFYSYVKKESFNGSIHRSIFLFLPSRSVSFSHSAIVAVFDLMRAKMFTSHRAPRANIQFEKSLAKSIS